MAHNGFVFGVYVGLAGFFGMGWASQSGLAGAHPKASARKRRNLRLQTVRLRRNRRH